MKVIKQKDMNPIKVHQTEDMIFIVQKSNTVGRKAIVLENEYLFEFVSDITPVEKLKSLIEFLQKEVEKNDTEKIGK